MRVLLTALLLVPIAAFAGESVLPVPDVGDVAISLGGIILVILLLAWGLRRLPLNTPPGGGNGIKIITALPVGARDRIVLIEVGDQQLLVGMSPGRMQTLHVLDAPLKTQPETRPAGGFAARMRAAMAGVGR